MSKTPTSPRWTLRQRDRSWFTRSAWRLPETFGGVGIPRWCICFGTSIRCGGGSSITTRSRCSGSLLQRVWLIEPTSGFCIVASTTRTEGSMSTSAATALGRTPMREFWEASRWLIFQPSLDCTNRCRFIREDWGSCLVTTLKAPVAWGYLW